MHTKIAKYRAEILSLRIQRYSLAMIQLWLFEKYQVKASFSAISRSYKQSLAKNLDHPGPVAGSDYERYKHKASLRLQHRVYNRRLDRFFGLVQYYLFNMNLKPKEILVQLQLQGVKTSLSSVYRIVKVIRGQESQASISQET